MVSISRQYPLVTAKHKSSVWYKIIVFRNMFISFSPLPERSQCTKLHSGYKTMSVSEDVALLHNSYTYFFSSCSWSASVAAACWGKETVYQLSTKGKKQTRTQKKYSSSWVSLPSFFSTLCFDNWLNTVFSLCAIASFGRVSGRCARRLTVWLLSHISLFNLWRQWRVSCPAGRLLLLPSLLFIYCNYQLLLTQECTQTARLQGLSLLLLLPPLLKLSAETNASRVRATRTVLRCETKDVDKVCCSLLPFVFAYNLALLFCVCRGGVRFCPARR